MPFPRRQPPPVIVDITEGRTIRPVHPGRYIDYHLLELREVTANGIRTVPLVEAARRVGMSGTGLEALRRGRFGITASTAIGLERLTGIRAETWMETQAIWDLWQERNKETK